jgi:hypothetical protein
MAFASNNCSNVHFIEAIVCWSSFHMRNVKQFVKERLETNKCTKQKNHVKDKVIMHA